MARAEPGPTIDYTIFQAAILSAIKRLDDPCGTDVLRHLERVYPEQLNHSRLYQAIEQLVDRELVMKGSVDDRTNWYRLTERGEREHDALVGWMEGE